MRWLLILFLFPLVLHSQQEINIRQFSFTIPDSVVYGDTCHMSMHGYFHCNDITTQYFEIKNDTVYYYMLQTADDRYTNYKYISIETCPLASIDTAASYIWKDQYSPKYWSTVIELKRNTKRKGKIWNRVY